jgi:phosphoribosyl 1,2-cyclic phosphate phosphodiesterase
MRVTILGCGGSGGVPMIGGADGAGAWGDCDPTEPRNRRTRSSILVESGAATILIDTSPDLREQLLRTRTGDLTAVLFTHGHADHVHGIDELRAVKWHRGAKMDVYGTAATMADLERRFSYVFEGAGLYEPTVVSHVFDGPFTVDGVRVQPFEQGHGDETTVGYRIGDMAYSTDVVALDETAFAALNGVRLWIVDCLRMRPHPTHAHFALVLDWIARVKPRRAILTHLSVELDYRQLAARCPAGVEPAYDGMTLTLDGCEGGAS